MIGLNEVMFWAMRGKQKRPWRWHPLGSASVGTWWASVKKKPNVTLRLPVCKSRDVAIFVEIRGTGGRITGAKLKPCRK